MSFHSRKFNRTSEVKKKRHHPMRRLSAQLPVAAHVAGCAATVRAFINPRAHLADPRIEPVTRPDQLGPSFDTPDGYARRLAAIQTTACFFCSTAIIALRGGGAGASGAKLCVCVRGGPSWG